MTRTTMMPHLELLNKILETGDVDFLRETVAWLIQQMMGEEVSAQIGAMPNERTENRETRRNGYRQRELDTRIGTIELGIPKLRKGTYFPEWLLERWRPAEKALVEVVIQAYVNGVSTRKVDRIVRQLGVEGISKSAVSRMSKELDERVESFRNRPLEGRYPYIWLDATFPKVREGGRVISMALAIAIGVRETGEREILGFDLGTNEDGAFWKEFLSGLKARGMNGVQLVVSDAHEGLKDAIGAIFTGTSWQRCSVHFMRNVLSHVPKSAQTEVTDLVRTIFAQPSYKAAKEQLKRVVTELGGKYHKASIIVEEAAEDILAHMHFPKTHWRRLRSTNPLERLNREVKRRFRVVGIFPDRASVIRLGGAILLEQHEEWLAGRKYFSEASMGPENSQEHLTSEGTVSY